MSAISEARSALDRVSQGRMGVLWIVLLVSLAIHVAAGLVLGSIVIFREVFKQHVTFENPPVRDEKIEPRKLEHTVKVRKMESGSQRPQMQPRLAANAMADIGLPEITGDAKVSNQLTSDFLQSASLSGNGMGSGVGGSGRGLGAGSSLVSFFGIKDSGERIVLAVDVSLSMLEDDKGAMAGFERFRTEVKDMVDKLSPKTFFNIVLFDSKTDAFSDKMQLASNVNKAKAKEFLDRVFKGFKVIETDKGPKFPEAISKNTVGTPTFEAYKPYVTAAGSTRIDRAVLAAFDMNADAIFVVSDGRPSVHVLDVEATEARVAAQNKLPESVKKRNAKAADELFQKRLADYKKESEKRKAKGLQPRVFEGGFGIGGPTAMRSIGDSELIGMIRACAEERYGSQKNFPKVHCVAYAPAGSEDAFLKDLATEFRSRFRKVKALAPPI